MAQAQQIELIKVDPKPDEYRLPDDPNLAIKILGNGVPPLMMQGILETMI